MVTPARDVAFKVLLRVEKEASYASELLNSRLAAQLSPADRGLAQEIAMGCLRWQAQLDWLAACFSGKSPARWDPEVRVALRMGIYQLRFLERVPASAAVDQSVSLVKHAGKRSAAGLVNAVLRKVTAEPVERLLAAAGAGDEEREPVELSHPGWLLERWARHYGLERARAIARINNTPPPMSIRVPPGSAAAPGRPCRYVRGCREMTGEAPAAAESFVAQDEASQIVPHLLAPQDGERVLDLCAAPGVKTGALLELAPGAFLVACDVRLPRIRLAQQLVARGGREPLRSVVLDGTRPLPFRVRFDRILVDAPCSGTGTIRRNPEIKWRLQEKELSLMAARQRWLLSSALDVLAPGGRLVYSTCSIEPEENEAVVEESLEGRDQFTIRPVAGLPAGFLTGEGRALLSGRYFQTLPDLGLDGFFAAVIERKT